MFAVATDLDRTLIPNGNQEYDGSLPLFKQILREKKPKLIYVTGRNLRLVRKAMRTYGIPLPDHLVAEVGTVLYRKSRGKLVQDRGWIREVSSKSRGWDVRAFGKALSGVEGMELQDKEFQNRFKLSYNIQDTTRSAALVKETGKVVRRICKAAEIVYSEDETRGLGLLDILPRSATKLTGLEFVSKGLGLKRKQVIFCGDSGNDLLALKAGYPSVLVRNATHAVRKKAREMAGKRGRLYIAKGTSHLNGYYVSGIIEGLAHFGFIERSWA